MKKFEQIKNDETIIELYNKISKVENKNKGWAHHNLQHVINVANLVEKLLTDLNYDKQFIEEAKIAAILHDTGCTEGKEGHALRSYEFAKQYLKNNNIKLKNENLVLEAIKKVFKAIKAFSEKMQLDPKVLINNEKWQKFYNEN